MAQKKIERLGERRLNKEGDLMVIVEYNNNKDVLVQFPMYPNIVKKTTYLKFERGIVYPLKRLNDKQKAEMEIERKRDNALLLKCAFATLMISAAIWAFCNLIR